MCASLISHKFSNKIQQLNTKNQAKYKNLAIASDTPSTNLKKQSCKELQICGSLSNFARILTLQFSLLAARLVGLILRKHIN